jgi:hypothetical protein
MLVGHQLCDPQYITTHQAKRGSGNGGPARHHSGEGARISAAQSEFIR